MLNLLASALLGFGASLAFTVLAEHVAPRLGALAQPAADRWNRRRVPLLGGPAIAAAILLGAPGVPVHEPGLWILLGGALVMLGVGLVDDLRPLKPQTKFIAQVLVAAALASLGLQLRLTPFPFLNVLLTLVWIVGITNAFNLLDNMDGLAAGVAAITLSFRLGFFLIDGNAEGAEFAALAVGALLGFLVFNFHPASIFMGDAGSLFIGVLVSGLSLIPGWPYTRGTASVLLFPVLILLVPIFDTAFVTIARVVAGRSVAVGGRDHSSHRLVALGLSEREAVVALYVVSAIAGTVAALSYRYRLSYGVVLIAFLVIGVVLFGVYLGRFKVYPEEDAPITADSRFVTLIANFSYKRQVATIAMDLALIVLAYYSAYLLRFEERLIEQQARFVESLPLLILCQMGALAVFRVYQGVWRYTSLHDLVALSKATAVGVLLSALAVLAVFRFEGYSRSVFVLDWLLLVVYIVASRLFFRGLAEFVRPARGAEPVVIYGAGDGGVLVLRELRNNLDLGRRVVAFLDDDPSKRASTIQGVPVIGGLDALGDAIDAHAVREVVVSTEKISDERLAELTAACGAVGVSVVRASLRFE